MGTTIVIEAYKSIEFPNLHIMINNMPKSFSLFGIEIAFYGLIIAMGMILGICMACYLAKKSGQDYNLYLDFSIYAIIFSVIGARIYYVAFRWSYYKEHIGEIINIREGGLAIYGGVIAAVITAYVYTKKRNLSFGEFADTTVPGLLVGQIIGRWGNFFNREAFGQVASDKNPFAMRIYFDDEYSLLQVPDAIKEQMEAVMGKALSQIGYIQVQPTFLYESFWNLCVLTFILIFRKKKAFKGEILLWYLAGYGTGRFFIEGLRSDQLIMPFTGWPVSQFLSAVFVIAAVTLIVVLRRRAGKSK